MWIQRCRLRNLLACVSVLGEEALIFNEGRAQAQAVLSLCSSSQPGAEHSSHSWPCDEISVRLLQSAFLNTHTEWELKKEMQRKESDDAQRGLQQTPLTLQNRSSNVGECSIGSCCHVFISLQSDILCKTWRWKSVAGWPLTIHGIQNTSDLLFIYLFITSKWDFLRPHWLKSIRQLLLVCPLVVFLTELRYQRQAAC